MSSEETVTPVSSRTVSKTAKKDETEVPSTEAANSQTLPTPQGDTKWSFANRHVFMSPTDAITSPCTQQLTNRRFPKKGFRPPTQPIGKKPISKLADKENQHSMESTKGKPVVPTTTTVTSTPVTTETTTS